MNSPAVIPVSFEELVSRARTLAASGKRTLLGIAGAPGAGKSHLADRLVAALGPELAVLVPMDGFHLADSVLHALGRHDRKGAQDTFDAFGYRRLIERLRDQRDAVAVGQEGVIYAPHFERTIDEPIGSAIPVAPEVPLVVSEGNYLLFGEGPWEGTADVFDELWFLAPSEDTRLEQLIARHERFGRSPEEARERSLGSDQRNAEVINATAHRATAAYRLIG